MNILIQRIQINHLFSEPRRSRIADESNAISGRQHNFLVCRQKDDSRLEREVDDGNRARQALRARAVHARIGSKEEVGNYLEMFLNQIFES